jgi:hypothetical protein
MPFLKMNQAISILKLQRLTTRELSLSAITVVVFRLKTKNEFLNPSIPLSATKVV